jgi:hypothetical protein
MPDSRGATDIKPVARYTTPAFDRSGGALAFVVAKSIKLSLAARMSSRANRIIPINDRWLFQRRDSVAHVKILASQRAAFNEIVTRLWPGT